MKNNIDLTENRIFSEDQSMRINLIKALLPKLPWGKYITLIESDNDLDLESQRISIIAIGNKLERAKIKFYRQMDSGNYCACCGAAMNKKPWHMEFGLCQTCNDYYKNRKSKFFWDTKEVIQSSSILNI